MEDGDEVREALRERECPRCSKTFSGNANAVEADNEHPDPLYCCSMDCVFSMAGRRGQKRTPAQEEEWNRRFDVQWGKDEKAERRGEKF